MNQKYALFVIELYSMESFILKTIIWIFCRVPNESHLVLMTIRNTSYLVVENSSSNQSKKYLNNGRGWLKRISIHALITSCMKYIWSLLLCYFEITWHVFLWLWALWVVVAKYVYCCYMCVGTVDIEHQIFHLSLFCNCF